MGNQTRFEPGGTCCEPHESQANIRSLYAMPEAVPWGKGRLRYREINKSAHLDLNAKLRGQPILTVPTKENGHFHNIIACSAQGDGTRSLVKGLNNLNPTEVPGLKHCYRP